MNNGKVRIYELSRELSLENKDILAVCDRLNIAVKSHSSTITGEQAAQIRAEVKQAPSGKFTPKPKKPTPPRSRKEADSSAANGNRPARKQQILEIRRHRPKPEAERPQEPAVRPESPEPQASPESPASPSRELTAPQPSSADIERPERPAPPPTPKAPEQPPAAKSPERPRPSVTKAEPPQKPEPKPAPKSPQPAPPPAPAADEKDKVESPPSPPKPKLELVKPPSRPEKPKKPAKPEKRGSASGGEGSEAKSPTIPIREVEEEDKAPRLKPKPELRRPRPSKSETSDTSEEASETTSRERKEASDGAPSEDVGGAAKRPTPPRQRRKPRDKGDDEAEQQRKAGKVAKGKRRGQAITDEEEDVLEDITDHSEDRDSDNAEAQPSHLSVSLARPSKPKSKTGTPKPATSPPRSHRPQQKDQGQSRQQRRDRRGQEAQQERPEMITLTSGVSVHELGEMIAVPETEIIKLLFFKGIATNINQTLDIETAKMVAEEFDILVETEEAESEAKKLTEMLDVDDLENLQRRPPVVTIMGHVDHGKTTLLDSIRKTKVALGEAGGITQHIGAYHVDVEHDGRHQQVVFLDTPGHEAFTAMRARGTRVTDIAVLVVAADDGVRPQTIEAISHAKAAGVPLVVAINKVDKDTAQPDRVKQELMEHGLVPEEWGGETIMVPVSALKGEGLDDLLEMLLLVSEVEDLNANPTRYARGTIIEANLDKSRGPVATLLIQNGTLRVGDCLVVGPVFGKVRAMIDDRGQRVNAASPSFAVEVLGLNDVPAAGDEFEVYPDEKEARAIADSRADKQRQSRLQQAMASRRVSLSSLSAQAQEGDLKELNLILKADVQGSVEAILAALQQLPQDEVQVRVLLAAPGEISETDVDLAAASGAVLIGFNTTLASGARQAADRQGVDVRDYDVIYNLLDDIQAAMEGLLEPELVEEPLGEVEVRAVFPVRRGTVAGCYVKSGKVTRNCRLRVRRQGEVVYEGTLDSLKRMKDDVKEVATGFECGIDINGFNGWAEGDTIEAFKLVTKRRSLTPA